MVPSVSSTAAVPLRAKTFSSAGSVVSSGSEGSLGSVVSSSSGSLSWGGRVTVTLMILAISPRVILVWGERLPSLPWTTPSATRVCT